MMSRSQVRRATSALLLPLLLFSCGGSGDLRADAGQDFSVAVGESPTFDGCDSSGDITNYQWVILESPTLMASDIGKLIRELDTACSFKLEAAMIIDEVGTWVIELTVTDTDGNSSGDRVTVEVQ